MADNVTLPGTGSVVATDQVSGTHYQLVKLAYGALDSATLVTSSAGLPVSVANASLAITAAALPLPSGAATESTLSTLSGKVTACDTGAVVVASALPAGTNNIGDVDVLTLPSLPAGTNAIGKLAANDGVDIGDVTINNASLAVTGTFWQATQPVSGTLAATQSGTWNVGTVTTVTGITNVVHVDDNSGSLTVDGTVAATQSGPAGRDQPDRQGLRRPGHRDDLQRHDGPDAEVRRDQHGRPRATRPSSRRSRRRRSAC
jgi:hypothetical protein